MPPFFCSFLLLYFSLEALGTTQKEGEDWLDDILHGSGDLADSGDFTELISSSDPGSSSDTIFHNSDLENLICDQNTPIDVLDSDDPTAFEMAISDLPDIVDFEESFNALLSAGDGSMEGFPVTEPQLLPWVLPSHGVPPPGYNDPYAFIDCDRPVPISGFPVGRSPSQYEDLRSLCSFVGHFINQRSANMGCACKNPKSLDNSVRCFLALADPIFTHSELLHYCLGNCRCRSYPNGAPAFVGPLSFDLREPSKHHCKLQQLGSSIGQSGASSGPPATKKSRPNPPDFYGRTRSHRYKERYCRVGCSRDNFKCGTRSSGCVCQLSSVGAGLWQPMGCMPRIVAEAATTLSSLGGKKRKRDESGPPVCACNSTYVSEGCCQSGEGLVWEHPDLGLGQITPAAYDS